MSTVVLRQASFPEDSASVSWLLGEYVRQTETEKAEHGLVSPTDPQLGVEFTLRMVAF